MRAFIITCIFPLIIAVFLFLKIAAIPKINELLFAKKVQVDSITSPYIKNFSDSPPCYQDWFLQSNENAEVIFLLGSSELTFNHYKSIPYNFINQKFVTKIHAVGHAGNQCFSIYSQLLANEERLKNAPVIIVISPLWFQSAYAKGTTPDLFLEFTTEKFLKKIIENDSITEFKNYEFERILSMYKTYSSPTLALKTVNIINAASENVFSKILYAPIIFTDKLLLRLKLMITNNEDAFFTKKKKEYKRPEIVQDSIHINWDSLFLISKKVVLKKVTNNNWAVNDDYYNKYVNGERRSLEIVNDKNNQELKDFEMLLKLVHDKKVNARFLIFPMNPYAYTNLDMLAPLVDSLEKKIKMKNLKCLNLWISDTTEFEKGCLVDIMHLSKYGWLKADKQIIEMYHLNKY
jgi:D-alanine transfer protein